MNKIILIITIFFMIILSNNVLSNNVSQTIYKNVSYNLTQLPISGQHLINFSLAPNQSIFFIDITNNPKSNIEFPNIITLNSTETIAKWHINYTIPFFIDYNGNYTIIEDIIGVTNTVNPNIVYIKFNYNISHKGIVQDDKEDPYLIVEDAGKRIRILSFTDINFNETHKVTISSPDNSTIQIKCGQFIHCPNNITVLRNNQTSFLAEIFIPRGTLVKEYKSYINLTRDNITVSIDFEIVVRGDDITTLILYDVWQPTCYDSPENLAECYKKQAVYNSEIANALLNRLKQENLTCDIDTRINETIKYVEVGNIDPELLKDNRELRDKFNKLSNDYSSLSSRYTSCMTEKIDLERIVTERTEELSNEFILKRSELERNILDKENELSDNLKRKINILLGIGFFIFLFSLIIGNYLENNWVIDKFPKKIFIFFTGLFLMSWILFAIFG